MKTTEASKSQKKTCKHKHRKHKRRYHSDDSSVLLLDEDKDLPLPVIRRCQSIANHKRNKRQVQLGLQCGTMRDLRITQNFKIKEGEKNCIVNIDTSISGHESDIFTLRRNTSKKFLFNCCPPKERIIPTCTRKECDNSVKCQNIYNFANTGQNHKKSLQDRFTKKTRIISEHKKKKCSHRNPRSTEALSRLSSISLDPLHNSYEPLSSVSSDSDIELDSLIKRTKEKCSHRHPRSTEALSRLSSISLDPLCNSYEPLSSASSDSDIELDSLIKRTKERMVSFEGSNQFQTSIMDETATIYSGDMNISIHSLATVVLDPIENSAYSPTNSFSFLTDNEENFKCYDTFNNVEDDSSNISNEFKISELELENLNIPMVPIEHSSVPCLSFDNNKQLELDVTKINTEQTDDFIIDTACLQQIKKECNDDMFIIHSHNITSDDYILWNDDGLIEDGVKIERDVF